MRKAEIPGTVLAVSRFVFGTAGLFNVGRAAKRQRLLEAAHDSGFTHFDTAPLYGFGMAERDLAPFLRRHPDVTVTTKVGLYSPGGEEQGSSMIFLRKSAGRLFPALSRASGNFAIARARRSLDDSLRRLGRDKVDLYMLHEPDAALVDSDEWRRWLEDEVTAGRVGLFGLAADDKRLRPFLDRGDPLSRIVQTTDSLDRREADQLKARGRPLQITYGYISAARARGSAMRVPDLLRQALAKNRHGAIIVSTRREDRCRQFQALAEQEP